MTDYKKLVEALRYCKSESVCGLCQRFETNECLNGLHDAAAAIEELQAQLPKRGKWKTTDAFPHRVYCSSCFRTYVPNDRWQIWVDKPGEGGLERNYCPSCGAKMEVQE